MKRKEEKSAVYSYEQKDASVLPDEWMAQLEANAAAWVFFQAQTPSYRKGAMRRVLEAKQEATLQYARLAHQDSSERKRRFPAPFGLPHERATLNAE